MKRASRVGLPAIVVAAAIAGAIGCSGQDGPDRYTVTGNVTLNGKPAPVFELFFQPDTSQGNSGPGAVVRGREGIYETSKGKGVSVGPHRVDIIAFDGIPNAESSDGNALTIKTYQTTVTIPAEDSQQNFDVPASHLVK